jgi:phosphoenolpyruvate synthase/pyruvate phosphate dikinase
MGHGGQRQAMVFGNMGEDSGTGVAFTRNPSTGDNEFYGEYLVNASKRMSRLVSARRSI